MGELVPIVFVTDANYVFPVAAAIQSIIESSQGRPIEIYVISDNIGTRNKEKFLSFTKDNVIVQVIDVNKNDILSDLVNGKESSYFHVTNSAMLKFLLPTLLPQYEKLLYLDGDILVKKDIRELQEIDLQDCYAAAVLDIAVMHRKEWTKEVGREFYFNSGVMLINAARCRADDIQQKLMKAKLSHPNWSTMDQNAFNYVFQDNVKYISPKWNLLAHAILWMKINIKEVNSCYKSSYQSFSCLLEDAAILHFAAKHKPWLFSDVNFSKEWMDVFQRTPFRDQKLQLEPSPNRLWVQISRKMDDVCKAIERVSNAWESSEGKRLGGDSRFTFPWKAVTPGSRIVIYGGGVVGKTFLAQAGRSGYCHIAAICDKNPVKTGIQKFPVISVAELAGWAPDLYDAVIIAIERREIAKEIREDLDMAGIPKEKVKWLDPANRN